MELGMYTFWDLIPDPYTGEVLATEKRLTSLVEQARLTDEGRTGPDCAG
jgi:hypothetical protein